MKTVVKIVIVLIWTAAVIKGALLIVSSLTETVVKSGPSVNASLDYNHFMVIDATQAVMSAGSDAFWALTKAGADPFVPNAKDSQNPPIGWSSELTLQKARHPSPAAGGMLKMVHLS